VGCVRSHATRATLSVTDEIPLSVVVPTRDRPEMLDACLQALRRSLRSFDELIVADSASTNDATRAVAERHRCVYMRCEQRGASRARNAGWRRAKHGVVAFVDDDVRVEPGWAAALVDAFGRSTDASFVTGSVGVPSGEEPEYPVALMVDEDPFWIDASSRQDPGHSANIALRRSDLEMVGGFDEALGAGAKFGAAEDKDLIDRLVGAGLRGRYEPSVRATHVAWRGRGDILRLSWSYGIGTGVRIAKLLKTDRRRAKRAMYDAYWRWGLAHMWGKAKLRLKFLTLASGVRVAGMVAGILWGLPRTVRDGHLVTSSKR
jgi:glycosyltransferase involved in cell wall biosynthesis